MDISEANCRPQALEQCIKFRKIYRRSCHELSWWSCGKLKTAEPCLHTVSPRADLFFHQLLAASRKIIKRRKSPNLPKGLEPPATTTLFAPGKSWDNVRSTAAPYTESRLTRSVANERVGFPVVEHMLSNYKNIKKGMCMRTLCFWAG